MIRLPNDIIAIPDKVTHDRIGTGVDQTTTTDAELSFSIMPEGASVDSLKAEFAFKKNGNKVTIALATLSGEDQDEIVTLKLGQADFESDAAEQFEVKLIYTVADSTESSTYPITVDAMRLLYNIEFSPAAYKSDISVCPYTHKQSPVKGTDTKNEWYGLLMTYNLAVDLSDLSIEVSGGDVGSKTLPVMDEAEVAGTGGIRKVKWEGYDDTIDEPADKPYCVFPEENTKRPAPDHVAKEGDYKYKSIVADASDEGGEVEDYLQQTHEVKEITVHVRYNITDADI
jgi:hypothetical protein